MAQTLQTLRAQLDSASQLHQVAKTMKTLAAVNINQYEEATEAVASYFEIIELGLQIILRDRSQEIQLTEEPAGQTLGAVIFGSDQGLVGQFNNIIANYALDRMNNLGFSRQNRSVLVVGQLAAAALAQYGQPIEMRLPVPSSLSGVTGRVQDVLFQLDDWRTSQQIDQIVLFYNEPQSSASYQPTMRRLLPVNKQWLNKLRQREWDSPVLPIYRMAWSELFAALIRQFFFVSLYRALAESLASENASRLEAMQAAEKNIRERLDELQSRYHRLRQSSITEEVLDIASGYEALKEKGGAE